MIHYFESYQDLPLIVFLHGFPNNHLVFQEQINEFAKDYHILAIDLPGSSDNNIHNNEEYELDNLISKIEKLILEKTAQKKNKEIIFIGHDLGCFILDLLSAKFKNSISAQINISGMGINQYAARYQSLGQWAKSSYILFLHIPGAAMLVQKYFKQQVKNFIYRSSGIKKDSSLFTEAPNGFTPIRLYLSLSKKCRSLLFKKTVQKSSIPTLFIFGKDEKFLNLPDEAEISRFYSNGKNKIMDGGHWLLKDRYKEVNPVIRNFIKFNQMSIYES